MSKTKRAKELALFKKRSKHEAKRRKAKKLRKSGKLTPPKPWTKGSKRPKALRRLFGWIGK